MSIQHTFYHFFFKTKCFLIFVQTFRDIIFSLYNIYIKYFHERSQDIYKIFILFVNYNFILKFSFQLLLIL